MAILFALVLLLLLLTGVIVDWDSRAFQNSDIQSENRKNAEVVLIWSQTCEIPGLTWSFGLKCYNKHHDTHPLYLIKQSENTSIFFFIHKHMINLSDLRHFEEFLSHYSIEIHTFSITEKT